MASEPPLSTVPAICASIVAADVYRAEEIYGEKIDVTEVVPGPLTDRPGGIIVAEWDAAQPFAAWVEAWDVPWPFHTWRVLARPFDWSFD